MPVSDTSAELTIYNDAARTPDPTVSFTCTNDADWTNDAGLGCSSYVANGPNEHHCFDHGACTACCAACANECGKKKIR